MRLKDFIPKDLSQRDYSLYEQAMIARKDCFQWKVMRTYASMVQNPILEDLLIQESNIMYFTMQYYNNDLTE